MFRTRKVTKHCLSGNFVRPDPVVCKALTVEHLEHELNLAPQKIAASGANTVVVPANMHGFEMILPGRP